MKSYIGLAVANWFIEKASKENTPCTQITLNKWAFISHGWHLAVFPQGSGLLAEDVVAWKFGPVVPSLREHFRQFGSGPIESPGSIWMDIGQEFVPRVDIDDPARELLDWVWDKYGGLDPGTLIRMTHVPGSPWSQATKNGTSIGINTVIPNEIIRTYYSGMLTVERT